jgi:hypothetical protein
VASPARSRRGLSLLLLLAAAPARADAPLDWVVAVVDDTVITHSEVLAEARLHVVRIAEGSEGLGRALERPLDDPERYRRMLDLMVTQIVVGHEAQKLHQYPVSREELDQALADFKSRFGAELSYADFLRRFDVDETQVLEFLTRNLRVGRFLDQKAKASLRITDLEVERWLAEHPDEAARYLDPTLLARTTLYNQRYRQVIERWVDDLKQKANIRVLPRPEAAQ